MPDLSAPLRVTWDLPGDPRLASVLLERLREARVLFVDLGVTPEGSSGLPGIAGALAAAGSPRLTLTGGAEELARALAALGPEAARRADLQLLPPYPAAARAAELAGTAAGLSPSLWSTPEGLRSLAGALGLAAALGLRTVSILNPQAPAEPLGQGDRASAVAAWEAAGLGGRVELRVHDLFLAEALGLDPFRGYAGCQAGVFLAHVTVAGRLLACRTLPFDLGDLVAAPLSSLWAGVGRRDLRARLEGVPGGCAACGLEAVCRGGCRGLAPDLGRDASCPGVRGQER